MFSVHLVEDITDVRFLSFFLTVFIVISGISDNLDAKSHMKPKQTLFGRFPCQSDRRFLPKRVVLVQNKLKSGLDFILILKSLAMRD